MISADIQAMLDSPSDGEPTVPMICQCSGKIELDDYETERYICARCNQTYGKPEKDFGDD
jgi:hypothetical protein